MESSSCVLALLCFVFSATAQQRTFIMDERVVPDTMLRVTMPLLYSMRHPPQSAHSGRAARTITTATMFPSGRFLSMGQMPMSPFGLLGPLGLLGALRPFLGRPRTGLDELELMRSLAFPGGLGLASDPVYAYAPYDGYGQDNQRQLYQNPQQGNQNYPVTPVQPVPVPAYGPYYPSGPASYSSPMPYGPSVPQYLNYGMPGGYFAQPSYQQVPNQGLFPANSVSTPTYEAFPQQNYSQGEKKLSKNVCPIHGI